MSGRLKELRLLVESLPAVGEPQLRLAFNTAASLNFKKRSSVDIASNVDSRPKRIGVLSASFNPPTQAHITLVRESAKKYAFDEFVLLLAKANPDKAVFGAQLHERLYMLERIVQADELGMDSNVPVKAAVCTHGRFVDQLKSLTALYEPQLVRPFFVMGYDTVVRLFDPKYYKFEQRVLNDFFKESEIIAFPRSNHGMEDLRALVISVPALAFSDQIHIATAAKNILNASSSEVRKRISLGMPISELVAPSTTKFISEHGTYGNHQMSKPKAPLADAPSEIV